MKELLKGLKVIKSHLYKGEKQKLLKTKDVTLTASGVLAKDKSNYILYKKKLPINIAKSVNLIDLIALIESGISDALIRASNTDNIISLPFVDGKESLLTDWHGPFGYAYPAMSNDGTRPGIAQILIDDNLIVATDGHRLHVAGMTKNQVPNPILINANFVTLIKSQAKANNTLNITYSESQTQIDFGNWCLVQNDVSLRFPPYNQVIPTQYNVDATINLSAFIPELQYQVKTQKHRSVNNAFSSDGQYIYYHATDLNDDSQSKVVAIGDCDRMFDKIGFSPNYMLDALNGVNSVQIKLDSNAILDPILIESSTTKAVIMPLRLK